MRSMMTAGPALKKCNIAGYNCSYLPIDHPHAFDEVLYILMNGTGWFKRLEPGHVDVFLRLWQVGTANRHRRY